MWTPSRIPLARRVAKIAATTSSRVGTPSKAIARAESNSRSRWASRAKIRPS